MAILHNNVVPFVGGEYTIDQSLRFEDGSSAYLSRTPASAGNRKTWTFSCWVKRGNIGTNQSIIRANGSGDTGRTDIWFDTNDTLLVAGSSTYFRITSQKFRDVSAWYHLVFQFDTTQATADDRLKIYVNGVQITIFSTNNAYTQNTDYGINATVSHTIGSGYGYLDGYLSEVHFIDGQALDPSSFGEVDDTYGHWKPIRYTGTYGTNGFYLPFQGTFYNDASGNGNNWTANNLATTDVVLDSPTNNFCTLNPLDHYDSTIADISEGNLVRSYSSDFETLAGTLGASSGKWYFEFVNSGQTNWYWVGFANQGETSGSASFHSYNNTSSWTYSSYSGWKWNGDGMWNAVSYGDNYWTTGSIIGCAIDIDAGKIWWSVNNVWQASGNPSAGTNPAFNNLPAGNYRPIFTNSDAGYRVNFGQDSSFAGNKTAQNNTDANGYGDFYYSPPTGFLALCTANLSDPAVVPGENFNTVLYTGDGSSDHNITGVGFQPDLVWLKNRSGTYWHRLTDAVRGAPKVLYSNDTSAEGAGTSDIISLDSDGFSVGSDAGSNGSSATFVAWNWKANNTSGSSNTDGSITSTVAANVDAGFSVVSYTGTGSNATVGHGLSSAPDFIICKTRTATYSDHWQVGHSSLGWTKTIRLNLTDAADTGSNFWNDTAPTTSVFSLGSGSGGNASGDNYIAYCFHSVDGYSKFGSYTGNGSSDGTFVYTGFRPKFVLWKNTTNSSDWHIQDTERNTSNVSKYSLFPNGSYAESTDPSYYVDILSNGFKPRDGTYAWNNASGDTYIFAAFAEYPFKYTTAR